MPFHKLADNKISREREKKEKPGAVYKEQITSFLPILSDLNTVLSELNINPSVSYYAPSAGGSPPPSSAMHGISSMELNSS